MMFGGLKIYIKIWYPDKLQFFPWHFLFIIIYSLISVLTLLRLAECL